MGYGLQPTPLDCHSDRVHGLAALVSKVGDGASLHADEKAAE